MPDVRVHLEARVVHPLRPAQPTVRGSESRRLYRGRLAEALLQVRAQLLDGRGRAVEPRIEYQRTTDVHVGGVVLLLQLEEGRVEGR